MKVPAYAFILIFLLASLNSNSQISLSVWKNYSISQGSLSLVNQSSFTTLEAHRKFDLHSIDYTYDNHLEGLIKSINSTTYVNSRRTLFGNELFEPLFEQWNIYRDYYSQDTFDYLDLDVREYR